GTAGFSRHGRRRPATHGFTCTGQLAWRQRIAPRQTTNTGSRSSARTTMMYFTRMKAALILGVCLLGILLGVPNLFPAPAVWLPWRSVHLALDLRGGGNLLLEVNLRAWWKRR